MFRVIDPCAVRHRLYPALLYPALLHTALSATVVALILLGAAFAALSSPRPAAAQSGTTQPVAPITAPVDEETETCISCHAEEGTAWEQSAHGSVPPESLDAMGGASCVDCHGPYLKGHPAAGTLRLSVDSSLCQSCHAGTYDQWEHTQHAGEGVQCISCHMPHSQALRLTDEALCSSCHRDNLSDPLHAAHFAGEVSCTNCHMNGPTYGSTVASTDTQIALAGAPTHDFVMVNAQNCLTCHRDDVSEPVAATTQDLAAPTAGNPPATKATFIDDVLSVANLGFGIGIGGVLGIIFMLFAATALQGKDR